MEWGSGGGPRSSYGRITGMGGQPKAIGLVRSDVVGGEHIDLHLLAAHHGYGLVFTVTMDIGPVAAALVIAQHLYEHSASAVVVPSLEHAASSRHAVTDLAALITPMQVYPRGHRWSMPSFDGEERP